MRAIREPAKANFIPFCDHQQMLLRSQQWQRPRKEQSALQPKVVAKMQIEREEHEMWEVWASAPHTIWHISFSVHGKYREAERLDFSLQSQFNILNEYEVDKYTCTTQALYKTSVEHR